MRVVGKSGRRFISQALLPSDVRIVEVGPRDGLQNEQGLVPTESKVQFIEALAATGLKTVEATAFVSAKWVPQMGDCEQVMRKLRRQPGVSYPVLTPNMRGFDKAMSVNCSEVAIFGAASESFSRKNINCSIAESLERFKPIAQEAKAQGVRVRGYISCVVGCPYEGPVDPQQVVDVAVELLDMGCYEISLGDTIGIGSPGSFHRLLSRLQLDVPIDQVAVHCHDTYGQALANILTSLEYGVRVVDSSVAGLGGCPYAHGATGNVSTEDVVYMLHGLGVNTGVDLERICQVGDDISGLLMRRNNSRVAAATAQQRKNKC